MKSTKRISKKRLDKKSKKDFPISKETKERVEAAKAYIESNYLLFSIKVIDRY